MVRTTSMCRALNKFFFTSKKEEISELLLPGLNNDIALSCLVRVGLLDHAALSCVNTKFNKLIKSGQLQEVRKNMGIAKYCLYMNDVIRRNWFAFDFLTEEWAIHQNIVHSSFFQYGILTRTLLVGHQLLLFGYDHASNTFLMYKFSLISHTLFICEGINHPPSIDNPRTTFGWASLGSIAIIAGGYDEKLRSYSKSVEMYNSLTGRWEVLPCMHTERDNCSCFFMDDKFYVIDGNDNLCCGEEYDLETRKWRKIVNMYTIPYHASLDGPPRVAVLNNKLYAVDILNYKVMKYDKANNTWNVFGALPGRPIPHEQLLFFTVGLAFIACGEKLLFIRRLAEHHLIGIFSCCPKTRATDGTLEWKTVGLKSYTRGHFLDFYVAGF